MFYLIKTLYLLAFVDLIAAEASLPITLKGCESRPKCGHVLVDNMDNITCTAQINNLTDLTDYKVRFFLKRKGFSLNVQRCQLDLKDGCIEKRDKLCYCREQNEIVFNFVVLYDDSKAQITASLKKGKENEIFSEIFTAPHIIQAPKIESLQLLVKNMEVKNETEIQVSNDDKKLPLTLSSDDEEALQMCSLHYDQDLNTDSALSLKPETMTIKIKMCEKEIGRYILKILYEDDLKQTSPNISESSTKTTPKVANESKDTFLILLIIVSALFLILIIIFLLWKYKNFHRFNCISSQNNYPEITPTGRQLVDMDRDSQLKQLEVKCVELTEENLVLTTRHKKLEEKIQELENKIKDLTNTNQEKGNEDFGVRLPLLH
ncbi:polymorphic transmembrane cluster 2 transmembrane protein 9 [Biomphalaria pfeifferi]|uniref:Polymorphic transmembrane cluster 2 transmembrane protein 9 n=1 Tax=Biomphalaria pfeifferi TaxID=112525 RepID=A0AAD8C5I7_BIOPF|nr:polymorphic transmembrane cluster 2 transmembrane protein 9 [Biomphalaria pfeifferi]